MDLSPATALPVGACMALDGSPQPSTTFNVLKTLGATGYPQVIHNLCTPG
ncbi:hypothetical protein [Actinoplanes sp. M2I2]|nr:hypothetical protein [Actinoplanes sp. M2I2]